MQNPPALFAVADVKTKERVTVQVLIATVARNARGSRPGVSRLSAHPIFIFKCMWTKNRLHYEENR